MSEIAPGAESPSTEASSHASDTSTDLVPEQCKRYEIEVLTLGSVPE
jgi:hypothetical protein